MTDYPVEQTQFGFRWGPLEVRRETDDPKLGVVIAVWPSAWPGHRIEIRVSPKGQSMKFTEVLKP